MKRQIVPHQIEFSGNEASMLYTFKHELIIESGKVCLDLSPRSFRNLRSIKAILRNEIMNRHVVFDLKIKSQIIKDSMLFSEAFTEACK